MFTGHFIHVTFIEISSFTVKQLFFTDDVYSLSLSNIYSLVSYLVSLIVQVVVSFKAHINYCYSIMLSKWCIKMKEK
jgi:hypothetical protein